MTMTHRTLQRERVESASYSPEELTILLGVSRRKVYDGLNSGAIPCIRIGRRFVIPRAAIAEWLRNAGGQLKVIA